MELHNVITKEMAWVHETVRLWKEQSIFIIYMQAKSVLSIYIQGSSAWWLGLAHPVCTGASSCAGMQAQESPQAYSFTILNVWSQGHCKLRSGPWSVEGIPGKEKNKRKAQTEHSTKRAWNGKFSYSEIVILDIQNPIHVIFSPLDGIT